jgi:hypothetical protein
MKKGDAVQFGSIETIQKKVLDIIMAETIYKLGCIDLDNLFDEEPMVKSERVLNLHP